VTAYGLSVIAAAGGEERDGRTAVVLATGSTRRSGFGATAGLVVAGSAWLLLATGLGMSFGFGLQTGDLADGVARVLPAVTAYVPAVLLTGALGLAAFAWSARWAAAGWGLLFLFLTLGELGELLHLPDWAIGLSPFHHVPSLPGASVRAAPLVVLSVLATVVASVAWFRYRSRDID